LYVVIERRFTSCYLAAATQCAEKCV